MNVISSFLVVILVLLLPSSAIAIEVDNLYTAKVIISDKSAQSRSVALKKAMGDVLIKVGGHEDILQNSEMKKAVYGYKKYYRQYKYQKAEQNDFLIVSFDPRKINELFIKANLPLWGSLRPNIVIWLIVEDGFTRNIIYQDNQKYANLISEIQNFSTERGLPLIIPQRITNLHVSDIWGRFSSSIINASQTYEAEAAIILRLSNSSLLPKLQETVSCAFCEKQNFAIDWGFLSDTRNKNSLFFGNQLQGTEANVLTRDALKEITHKIYDTYASNTNEKQELTINVANINNLIEYSQVQQFLESLTSVTSVTLETVKGSERQFKLSLIGSPNTFLQTLKLNKELQQYTDKLEKDDDVPVFYWRKL